MSPHRKVRDLIPDWPQPLTVSAHNVRKLHMKEKQRGGDTHPHHGAKKSNNHTTSAYNAAAINISGNMNLPFD